MKKIISCIAVLSLPVLPLAAFDGQFVDSAVLRAEAVQQSKVPALDPVQEVLFPRYLAVAEILMRQDELFYSNPSGLGAALLRNISEEMKTQKSVGKSKLLALTAEEQRAVYFAVNKLLPEKNRVGVMRFKEYSPKYPVSNWPTYDKACYQALGLVYRDVQRIATLRTLSGEAAVRTGSSVQLKPVHKELFEAYLELVRVLMCNDQVSYSDASGLGAALLFSVSRTMQGDKTELTSEEQRAVYYALHTLLPAKDRVGIMSVKQYSAQYPVQNWEKFHAATLKAFNLIYQAVQDIAIGQTNYQANWLMSVSH